MKRTIIMLAVIATILVTWLTIGTIGFLLSDTSLKDCLRNDGLVMMMLTFGWIPAVIVGFDLKERE